MKSKLNCWEFSNCGLEPGGKNSIIKGICPAAIDDKKSNYNSGKAFGRICWGVSGTMCTERVTAENAKEICSCLTCKFYITVKKEEGNKFKMILPKR